MKKILLLAVLFGFFGCEKSEDEPEDNSKDVRFGEELGTKVELDADAREAVDIICESLKRYSDNIEEFNDREVVYKFRVTEKACGKESEEKAQGPNFFAELVVPVSGDKYLRPKTTIKFFSSDIITHESPIIDRVCDDFFAGESLYNQYDEGSNIYKYDFAKEVRSGQVIGAVFRVGRYQEKDGSWTARSIEQVHITEGGEEKYDGVSRERYYPKSCSDGTDTYIRQTLIN